MKKPTPQEKNWHHQFNNCGQDLSAVFRVVVIHLSQLGMKKGKQSTRDSIRSPFENKEKQVNRVPELQRDGKISWECLFLGSH